MLIAISPDDWDTLRETLELDAESESFPVDEKAAISGALRRAVELHHLELSSDRDAVLVDLPASPKKFTLCLSSPSGQKVGELTIECGEIGDKVSVGLVAASGHKIVIAKSGSLERPNGASMIAIEIQQ